MIIHSNERSRYTREEKERNNYEYWRNKMDAYDMYYGDFRDHDKIEKFKINYNLFNGKLDVKLYDNPTKFVVGEEEVSFDYQNISHYPLISQITNTRVGERIHTPFRPMITDNTPEGVTYAKQELNNRISGFLQQSIQAKKNNIMLTTLQKEGVSDIFSLSPEDQLALQSQVDQQTMASIPKDTMDYLQFQYQSPTARQAQRMLDFLAEFHNIKYMDVMLYKHRLCTGEGYLYHGIRGGRLKIEAVSPAEISWGGSQGVERIQNGMWAKREEWLSAGDVIQRFAKELTEKDIREMEFYAEPVGGTRHSSYDGDSYTQRMFMHNMSSNPMLAHKYRDLDIKTKEGQRRILDAYVDVFNIEGLTNNNNQLFGVRCAHMVMRDKKKMYQVGYVVGSELKKFWVAEHYNIRGDEHSVTEHWVDEIVEAHIAGTHVKKYIGIQPIPYQNLSLNNPWGVTLPYSGGKYGTHGNIVTPRCFIDLGKTLNKDFDVAMASIKHDMATNIGRVFIMFSNIKPPKISWPQWFSVMRNGRLLLADIKQKGTSALDLQYLTTKDLSTVSDVSTTVQYLGFLRQELMRVMFTNEAQLGAVGQYTTNENIKISQSASYNQTALFDFEHNKIMEAALLSFLNIARYYYKKHIEEAAVFLNDVELAELRTGPFDAYTAMGLSLHVDPQDIKTIKEAKQYILPMLQNDMSGEAIMKLIFSHQKGEILDIFRKETTLIQQRQQKKVEELKQIEQQKSDTMLNLEKLKQDREDVRQERSDLVKLEREKISVQRFALQNDINRDGQSDFVEKAVLDLDAKMRIHNDELAFKREELALKEKLGLKK